jgi:hypothetical protein
MPSLKKAAASGVVCVAPAAAAKATNPNIANFLINRSPIPALFLYLKNYTLYTRRFFR